MEYLTHRPEGAQHMEIQYIMHGQVGMIFTYFLNRMRLFVGTVPTNNLLFVGTGIVSYERRP